MNKANERDRHDLQLAISEYAKDRNLKIMMMTPTHCQWMHQTGAVVREEPRVLLKWYRKRKAEEKTK